MSFNDNYRKDEIELITEAIQSNDSQRLSELSTSVYINVRKAVARNKHSSNKILNRMIEIERASSVLYWLTKHPSCTSKKVISKEDLEHKCVTCDIPELQLFSACMSCTK